MTNIDPSKLNKLLDDLTAVFEQARSVESMTEDTIQGALRVVTVIQQRAGSGALDVEDWPPTRREPLDKITAPTGNKVRRHDRDTSWAAAWAQTPEKSQKLYRIIYALLSKHGGMTDEELHETLDNVSFPHSVSGLRTRRSELTERGWVKASGDKRPTKNGQASTVWVHVPEEEE